MRQRMRSTIIPTAFAGLAAIVWWVSPNPRGLTPALHHPQTYVDRVGADQASVALVCLLCWIVLAWLAAGLALTAASSLPGVVGRASAALAGWVLPATLRRAAALALGLSLATGGGAAGAMIATSSPAGRMTAVAAAAVDWPAEPSTVPVTGADLDWPVEPAPPSSHRAAADPHTEIVVLRGDSLWRIAARSLGPNPSSARIAQEWPRWYAANRHVIGPDPDLILPGQRLVAPPSH